LPKKKMNIRTRALKYSLAFSATMMGTIAGIYIMYKYLHNRRKRTEQEDDKNMLLEFVKIKECKSNEELISHLVKQGSVRSKRVHHAMSMVDRGLYCYDFTHNDVKTVVKPYNDGAMPIPYNATISAPHMHAQCLEALVDIIETKIKNNEPIKVLDVGSGSGYVIACLTHMILYENQTTNFQVYGIDHIPSLVNISLMNVKSDPMTSTYLDAGKIKIITGDGFAGIQEESPFDVIHIGAACAEVPSELFNQLAVNGRFVLPLGDPNFYQSLTVVSKSTKNEKLIQPLGVKCRFVPLTDTDSQLTKTQTGRKPRVLHVEGDDKMIVMPFIISAQDGGPCNLQNIKWDTADNI
jgi:protein-L-isoaspartate(D-aspartate) O-methyltransferase